MLGEKSRENQETLRLVLRDRNHTDKVVKQRINSSRKETWMRLIVLIVSGVILCVWSYLIILFVFINFIYGIFTGKRLRELAEMSEIWNTQMYYFNRYIFFLSNVRPFPFTNLEKSISKFE